ncbi:hypothetical protein Tco_0543211 [Tanacetum coccineum]
MITFLKHVGRYTHSKLRNKKFDEVQVLYEKAKKSIQDFVPIGSAEDERLIEKMNKKAAGEDTSKKEKVLEEPDSTKMEVKQEEVEESTRKRPGTILKMKARKKARKQTHVDSDASKKKTGSPRMKRMSNRKKTDSDLEEEEYLKTFLKIVPDEEGIRASTTGSLDLMEALDGLKPFFEMVTRVHILIMEDDTGIHMLAERKYPLTKKTLEKMMSLKLVAESASDSAYDLLRYIQKQIDESGSYDGTLAIPEQMATGKQTSNLFIAVSTASTSVSIGSKVSTISISLDLSRLATTLNRLERSIQIGINSEDPLEQLVEPIL